MNQDLIVNLVPIELGASPINIHISADPNGAPNMVNAKYVGGPNGGEKFSWDIVPFQSSSPFEVSANNAPMMKRLVEKALGGYFLEKGLIVSTDFIGRVVALKFCHECPKNGTDVYKTYAMRVLAPWEQL